MSKTIVVVGVTGAQGGSVARTFLSLPGWHVRGITRNLSSTTAQTLAQAGVELVQGDLDDKASLIRAFEGANVIFANTDFFAPFFQVIGSTDPQLSSTAAKQQHACDREVAQGMNIAEAAETPSVLKTLERFIFSSLCDSKKLSGGKYPGVYHHNSKAEMERLIEQRCPGVFARMSTVHLGNYVTNWRFFPKMMPQKTADGNSVLERTPPPEFRMPFVVTERDTGVFVKALLDMPVGKNLLAVSEWMTMPELAALWGRVFGTETEYRQVSLEQFFQGAPVEMTEELGAGFEFYEEFGFTGGDPNIVDPFELNLKIPTTSMEEYLKTEDWSSLNAQA